MDSFRRSKAVPVGITLSKTIWPKDSFLDSWSRYLARMSVETNVLDFSIAAGSFLGAERGTTPLTMSTGEGGTAEVISAGLKSLKLGRGLGSSGAADLGTSVPN